MKKAPIGSLVFLKKHVGLDSEIPYKVVGHCKKKSGHIVAVLDTGEKIGFGKLTDVPCSEMECGNCKWHPRKGTKKVQEGATCE